MKRKFQVLRDPAFRHLLQRIEHPQRYDLIVLEGLRAVRESLFACGRSVYALCFHEKILNQQDVLPLIRFASRRRIPLYLCNNEQYQKLKRVETGPGIIGIWKWKPEKKWTPPRGRYIYLYEIRDPGNLGTIIRTARAMGFSGLLLSPKSVSPFNPKVARASMGTILHIPVWIDVTPEKLIQWHQKQAIPLTVLYHKGNTVVWSFQWKKEGVLIVGSETEPLPQTLQILPKVFIPMSENVESLNVASAVTIGMYEWTKSLAKKRRKRSS